MTLFIGSWSFSPSLLRREESGDFHPTTKVNPFWKLMLEYWKNLPILFADP